MKKKEKRKKDKENYYCLVHLNLILMIVISSISQQRCGIHVYDLEMRIVLI
jgi:hypothetical protein